MKFLTKLTKIIFFQVFLISIFTSNVFAQEILIKKINFDENKNLEIILSAKTSYKTYLLKKPDRLVIDIANASLDKDATRLLLPNFIEKVRKNKKDNNDLRIVFDLKQSVGINKTSFIQYKDSQSPKILVSFDLESVSIVKKNPGVNNVNMVLKKPEETKKIIPKPIIVIDAGHGGKDPGTIGDYARTKEKNITLSYARELAKHLTLTGNYKVYLTRDSDIFIPLKDRVQIARRKKADLFISIHANAAEDRDAKGFSIYTLSEKSSDKQAELLAQKENRADIIAGINFNGASADVLKTLIDLSQRSSMNSSASFANLAIQSLKKTDVKILHNTHRFAGFMVLTAPDMTSVLMEIGYLSNKHEESQLNSLIYKRNMVKGLVDAINQYFKIESK